MTRIKRKFWFYRDERWFAYGVGKTLVALTREEFEPFEVAAA